jgi:hypothetical protein
LTAPIADRDAGLTLRPDRTVADAGLQRVLDRRLASDGADAQGLSVGLTFQDVDGRWCRTFQSERDGWGGLACRADEAWTVTALAALAPPDGEVRMASSETAAGGLTQMATRRTRRRPSGHDGAPGGRFGLRAVILPLRPCRQPRTVTTLSEGD